MISESKKIAKLFQLTSLSQQQQPQTQKITLFNKKILDKITHIQKQDINIKIMQYLRKQLEIVTRQNNNEIEDKQYNKFLLKILQEQSSGIYQDDFLRNQVKQCRIKSEECYLYKMSSQKNGESYSYIKVPGDKYFLINNSIILDVPSQKIATIFTKFTLKSVIEYLQICLHYHKIIKIVTTQEIWSRYLLYSLCILLSTNKQTIETLWKIQGNLQIFQNNEMSELANHTQIAFKRKFWYELTYDIVLKVWDKKYVIYGKGVRDNQLIYGAWRRDIISQQQYCLLIDKVILNNSEHLASIFSQKPQNNLTCSITPSPKSQIQQKQSIDKSLEEFSTEKIFMNFSQSQLFSLLPANLIQELFTIGAVTKHNKNSIIYKKRTTKLTERDFYVIVGGACISNEGIILKEGSYFNLSDLIQYRSVAHQFQKKTIQEKCDCVTVASNSALIYSIDIRTLKFILGHFFKTIQQIYWLTLNSQTMLFLQESLQKLDIKLSNWTKKSIIYDSIQNQLASENQLFSRKLQIGKKELKISTDYWKNLINQDINILFLTKNTPIE